VTSGNKVMKEIRKGGPRVTSSIASRVSYIWEARGSVVG
jgi:hypothetical protein